MSWTYDPDTDVGRVRLLIPDRVESSPIFSDEEITAILAIESSNVKLATAAALLVIATDEVLVQKRIKLLDLMTDGPAEAIQLRLRANELRRQVEEGSEDSAGAIATAEMVLDTFSARQRLRNQRLRNT
ncbi:MAG: hypothetical protein A3J75_06530 [Acidobacteria bacterium RBG_16_68_9]|nr:MAG: hypothetical protein A3J75_06530 [Acidobacteria bacterium RBG_16_68_9]